MDTSLSRFVDETRCDPSFARDLLEGKNWDYDEALKAFKEFSLEPFKSESDPTTKTPILTKFKRGISVVNSDIVTKARTKVLERDQSSSSSQFDNYQDVAKCTFVLPDFSTYSSDLASFLREDLIETSALVALEQSGHLNWWADIGLCQRLLPLATVGDGNCLLHAASLGMWGFHDRLLTLRKALFRMLSDDPKSPAIKRRWKLQQFQKNMESGGLVYSDEEWEAEWTEVLRLASTSRRKMYSSKCSLEKSAISPITEEQTVDDKHTEGSVSLPPDKYSCNESTNSLEMITESTDKCDNEKQNRVIIEKREGEFQDKIKMKNTKDNQDEKAEPYKKQEEEEEGAFESLEDIHVFVLAHVLRRPIIIISDKFLRDFSGDPIAPIPFGGIYLPYECPSQACHKTPLILVFESAHFSAAVVIEDKSKQSKGIAAIPVVYRDLTMLPLHFSVDPGEKFDWSSLNEETQIPSKLTINPEKQFNLLEKYLNIAHIRASNILKKDSQQVKTKDASQSDDKSSIEDKKQKKEYKNGEGKELSWLENKVGNIAGKIKKLVDSSTVCVAKIQTNEKPEYYDEMINNYLDSARKRFEEKKLQSHKTDQYLQGHQPCINPGCSMYGHADTSYLCSGCYKTQKNASQSGMYSSINSQSTAGTSNNSFKSFLPPVSLSSYVPYDYFSSGAAAPPPIPPKDYPGTSVHENSIPKCRKDGCEFYGSSERQGYCSSCFKKEGTAN